MFFKCKLRRLIGKMGERKKRYFFWPASPSSVFLCCFSLNVTFLSSEIFLHWHSCSASSLPTFLHKAQWRHGTCSFTPWRIVSTLYLELTTPVQPLPLCTRKGAAYHHAYTKMWPLGEPAQPLLIAHWSWGHCQRIWHNSAQKWLQPLGSACRK